MPKLNKKLLSVIVPAYKKEGTIKKDLEHIDTTLKDGLPKNFDYEILCVVDGSPDNTLSEAKKANSSKIKVLSYDTNRGKGYAVRYGMKRAKGNIISFLDAGREIRPGGVVMLMAHMDWYGADVIVGSKRHPASRLKYPLSRHILSIGYHLGTKILFGLSVSDTQSGLKLFKRKVIKKILPKLVVEGYAMDIEMLAVARHMGFNKIYDAPVEIRYSFDDLKHASELREIWSMFIDTLKVFFRLKILRSYD